MIPKIGATIRLRIPDRRVPKNTKPTPGLCENGLPKFEIAISTNNIAQTVSVTPRDLSGTIDSPHYHQCAPVLPRFGPGAHMVSTEYWGSSARDLFPLTKPDCRS